MKEIKESYLNIVDLAGSERRIKDYKGTSLMEKNKRVARDEDIVNKEARYINMSLSTLGRIFGMLSNRKLQVRAPPYRESQLTRLL